MSSFFYVIACDCGSESVRSCIVQYSNDSKKSTNSASTGKILITRKKDIAILHPKPEYAEQSSEEIWNAVKSTIKECINDLKINSRLIKGIAFTATCSSALIGTTLPTGNDVIVWMDHRAIGIAEEVTKSDDEITKDVLQQFGDACSPEFTVSKIFWLKRYAEKTYENTDLFLELPCLLTFNCVKDNLDDYHSFRQSICSAVCKHGLNGKTNEFPYEWYKKWGLDNFNTKICQQTLTPGRLAGYMSENVRNNLDIESQDVAVASSIIDAHAGVLGMIVSFANAMKKENKVIDFENVLCMIGGTSTCAMVLSKDKILSKKVWGPYWNVVINDYYVREAGQSAAGKLIDFIVDTHPERKTKFAQLSTRQVIKQLNDAIFRRRSNVIANQDKLSKEDLKKSIGNAYHVNPDLYGNRTPLAEPELRGAIYGLKMGELTLIEFYEAIVEGLAYEMRYIVESLEMNLSKLKVIVSGGLTRNELYMQLHSDILGCELISMKTEEADMMLVGTSILAHQAVRNSDCQLKNLEDIEFEDISYNYYKPEPLFKAYNEKKYKCYRKLTQTSLDICNIMKND